MNMLEKLLLGDAIYIGVVVSNKSTFYIYFLQ